VGSSLGVPAWLAPLPSAERMLRGWSQAGSAPRVQLTAVVLGAGGPASGEPGQNAVHADALPSLHAAVVLAGVWPAVLLAAVRPAVLLAGVRPAVLLAAVRPAVLWAG